MQTLALAFLAATAIGGIAWVFVYPMLSGEKKAESRRASIARPEPAAARQADKNQRSRREQVEGSLKELEARRQKDRSVPAEHPHHPGRTCPGRSRNSGSSPACSARSLPSRRVHRRRRTVSAPSASASRAGFGLPRWLLGYLKKRREKAFLKALPDAVDVIVRGIKAGLPLFESHQGRRGRRAGAAEERVPGHHRDPGDRHAARRSLRAPL